MDKLIYGGDTETVHGKPNSFQFYSEDTACDEIIFVREGTAFDALVKWCSKRQRRVEHVVYVHNLAFDLPEFLYEHMGKLVGPGGDFEFKAGKWFFRGVYGQPTFCRITNGHDISVILVDSFSYFRGSLAKGAELFCPDLPKLKRPDGLGEKRFHKRDSEFCEYAMRDAVVTYHMGRAIEAMHREFDLQQCVSVADMSARIFRRHYLRSTIPQPSRDIIEAALQSYHGGKNNLAAAPGWHTGTYSIDIKSAYPDAMHGLPSFSNEKLYKRFRGKAAREVPPLGVYCVRGKLAECEWPVIFSHSFKPLHGAIEDVWVQGFELNEALRSGEFKASRIQGHFYDQERDHEAPPLRNFVQDFYQRKEREKDKVRRYMQKLILNSLSGKFIQTRKSGRTTFVDIDAGTTTTAAELVAGGMFHPFIASAITAHTRARIHRLEHQYKALHTATDGIFTKKAPKPSSEKLGAVAVEAHGELLLVRNKLYILYAKNGETPSKAFKGKRICKYALHGFQGSVHDLERLIATGRRRYSVNRPNTLKVSLSRGLQVNKFERKEMRLHVGALKVVN